MKTDDINRIINDLQENIKAGADINAGTGGYDIGTTESQAAFVVERNHSRLQHLVKTFFDTYLNRVEESEGGRLFFPIVISNCRAATIAPLNDLLDEMAELSGAKPRPEINNDF